MGGWVGKGMGGVAHEGERLLVGEVEQADEAEGHRHLPRAATAGQKRRGVRGERGGDGLNGVESSTTRPFSISIPP